MRFHPIVSTFILVAFGAASVFCQQPGANPLQSARPTAPTPAGGEALQVHGYWKIDVHNADGSLAGHREFENSILPSQAILHGMLIGNFVMGGFAIRLSGSINEGVGDAYNIVPAEQVMNSGYVSICSAENCAANLTTTLTPATAPANQPNNVTHGNITLQGQFAPSVDYTVGYAQTSTITCTVSTGAGGSAVSPRTCSQPASTLPALATPFTGTSFTPLRVLAGQYVLVSVALSFS